MSGGVKWGRRNICPTSPRERGLSPNLASLHNRILKVQHQRAFFDATLHMDYDIIVEILEGGRRYSD